jgi:hypothetical protein
MVADSITAHRLALRTANFDPLPDDGKECHLIGWSSKTNSTDTEIRSWKSLAASRNTGILCKHTPALDIDITNPAAAEAVEAHIRQHLGIEPLVRTGLPPKRLIPFRTEAPFGKISAKLTAADGSSQKLEWLGDGQQFVAFGLHPSGRAYRWRNGEPGQVPRSALPLIDEEGAVELIDAAADLLVMRFGYRRDNKRYRRSGVLPLKDAGSDRFAVVVNDLTQALWKLDPVEWRGRRKEWLELMNGCKGAGIDVETFIRWSTSDPVYENDGEKIWEDWQSLAGVHGGSLRAALRQRGIKVGQHTPEVPPTAPGRHHNKRVGDRIIGACVSFKRNPTERSLFSHACLIAEIVYGHGLVPRWYRTARPYMDLLCEAAKQTELWKALGPGGCRRSIESGFAHVEAKHGCGEVGAVREV